MGVRSFVPQKLPLLHAEAVLLIGDGQGRTAKDHIVFNESVGADEDRDLPLAQFFQHGFPLLFGGGAGEQGAGNAALLHQRLKGFVMLPGQKLGGSHQRPLHSVFGSQPQTGGGHHGFAAAHIPLHQAAHPFASRHVGKGLVYRPPLGAGGGKRKNLIEILRWIPGQPDSPGGDILLPHQLQTAGKLKKFLKNHPFPGLFQRLLVDGIVDVFIGIADVAQIVLLADVLVQAFGELVGILDGLGGGLEHQRAGKAAGETVNRQQSPGDHPPSCRFKLGVGQLFFQQRPFDFAEKGVFLPLAQLRAEIGLVEIHQIDLTAFIKGPQLGDAQPFADQPGGRGLGHGGQNTAIFPHRGLGNGIKAAAVLIFPGKVLQAVPQGEKAQLVKKLGFLFSHTPQGADIVCEMAHGNT